MNKKIFLIIILLLFVKGMYPLDDAANANLKDSGLYKFNKEVSANGHISSFLTQLKKDIHLYRLGELLICNRGKSGLKLVNGLFKKLNIDDEKKTLKKMISDILEYPESDTIEVFRRMKMSMGGIDPVGTFVHRLYENTELKDKEKYLKLYKSHEINEDDPFMKFVRDMKKLEVVKKRKKSSLSY